MNAGGNNGMSALTAIDVMSRAPNAPKMARPLVFMKTLPSSQNASAASRVELGPKGDQTYELQTPTLGYARLSVSSSYICRTSQLSGARGIHKTPHVPSKVIRIETVRAPGSLVRLVQDRRANGDVWRHRCREPMNTAAHHRPSELRR